MKESFYGSIRQTQVGNEAERHAEEIAVKGFTIIEDLYGEEELTQWRDRIDRSYALQESEFGRANLESIQELDVCRAPLLHDRGFVKLATHSRVLDLVRHFLGDWFILNLQNAIINRPGTTHHQSSWHRDLPYQNWVTSRPLAINALFAIDTFSEETGGTHVVPFTHKTETLPSDAYIDRNRVIASAPAGSAIVFDSMLFHRAGANRSGIVRRAVNHLYTTPIIKQQYDFPRALGSPDAFGPAEARLLGFTSQVPFDDQAWRAARAAKLGRTGAP